MSLQEYIHSFFQRKKDAIAERNDNVNALSNTLIRDGIATLKEVIALLPPERMGVFTESLQAIEARYQDPDFYLSVIGNFNSGKSTFLNALLGMDLLSVRDLPTTAVPTYIRWNRGEVMRSRSEHGRNLNNCEPCVKVVLKGGESYYLDGSDMTRFQKETGIHLPKEIGSRIDYITTENKLADRLRQIEISFPEDPRFKNFCLIDTPGINPGEQSNAVHIVNTQSVLRETSDCAIILYPGIATMEANMKVFIEENAPHLMGNSIVLLTKMDLIPGKEWKKIQTYTEKVLREQFHQEQPLVYPLSAWMAREYQSGRETHETAAKWATSFQTTTEEILNTSFPIRRTIDHRNHNILW